MFLELIATFAAGLGMAGFILVLNKIFGGRLPRWMMPAGAGLAMIFLTIWMEMSWSTRTQATFPETLVVAEEVSETAWWRPWTYVWPQVTRMIVLDRASVQTNENAPDIRLVELYLFGRWQPANRIAQLIHCKDGARADVSDEALSKPDSATWLPLEADDDLIRLSCKG